MLFHAFKFALDLIQDVLAYQQVSYQGKAVILASALLRPFAPAGSL